MATSRAAIPEDTSPEEVAAIVDRVSSKAEEWANLPPAEKLKLFEECLKIQKTKTQELGRGACVTRGYDFDSDEQSHLAADAILLGTVLTAAWVRGAIDFFEAIVQTGRPPVASQVTPRPDGTSRVKVFPSNLKDTLVGDVGRWPAVPIGQGGAFELVVRGDVRQFNPLEAKPSVSGVLGAGNTEILNDIIDPLCKLNSVVIYKSNPVQAHSNRVKAQILAPLIERGFVGFVWGGAEQGKLVVENPKVDHVGITGSCHTYDKIVWGDRDKADPSVEPVIKKPVCAELGSVNPYIIVPGDVPWSKSDLEAQAAALVAYKLVNNAHVCAAPQVIVTCRQWPQRDDFLNALRKKLRQAPATSCFYPGTMQHFEKHLAAMGDAAEEFPPSDGLKLGMLGEAQKNPILQVDLKVTEDATPFGLSHEAFSPVMYEVALDTAPDLETFFPKAVDFCHERVWGNLTCAVIVDDATKARHQERFDAVVDSMRFGTIGINFPPSAANCFPSITWGGFPGNSPRDIQSGIGQFGNFCCYENVEKTIMCNRFRNLHEFQLATGIGAKRALKKRARRLGDVFAHMTYWRVVKFASAHFCNL